MAIVVKRAETANEMAGIRAIRLQVFVEEQGVPRNLELDEFDARAIHAAALSDGSVVGTGRLILDNPGHAIIGRMSVAQPLRRRGVGDRILAFLEGEALSRGVWHITLHAQSYVKEFYSRHGYKEDGEPFMEAGILHVLMSKKLG